MLVLKRLNYVRTYALSSCGRRSVCAHFAFIQNFTHTSDHNRHRSWSTIQLILVVNRSTEILCSYLTFTCPCIANVFAAYNQQDAAFHNLCISVRRSTCFRRFYRPSSGAQNCTYSVRYLSDQNWHLLNVERCLNVASCWLSNEILRSYLEWNRTKNRASQIARTLPFKPREKCLSGSESAPQKRPFSAHEPMQWWENITWTE